MWTNFQINYNYCQNGSFSLPFSIIPFQPICPFLCPSFRNIRMLQLYELQYACKFDSPSSRCHIVLNCPITTAQTMLDNKLQLDPREMHWGESFLHTMNDRLPESTNFAFNRHTTVPGSFIKWFPLLIETYPNTLKVNPKLFMRIKVIRSLSELFDILSGKIYLQLNVTTRSFRDFNKNSLLVKKSTTMLSVLLSPGLGGLMDMFALLRIYVLYLTELFI